VLRYRIDLESRNLAPRTINLRLGAVRRLAIVDLKGKAGHPHDPMPGWVKNIADQWMLTANNRLADQVCRLYRRLGNRTRGLHGLALLAICEISSNAEHTLTVDNT
jgi:hypothetical protein